MFYKKLEESLVNFLINYLKISNCKNLLLGLSGGLDSSIVAFLCKKAMPENSYCLIMPSKFSNTQNMKDALDLCKQISLPYEIISIDPILNSYQNITKNMSKIRLGNLSARIRMSILYDYSASIDALVVGTSNKSEIMLGYGTIYGDLAYAMNPIGEIYKSDLFEFAKFLGISQNIINKAPSADLYEGQSDEAELGYSYEKIDSVLKALQNNDPLDKFDRQILKCILERIEKNEFKTRMPKIAGGINERD